MSDESRDGYVNVTAVQERDLCVATHWLPAHNVGPSTWIVAHAPPQPLAWERDYAGPVSAGGLDEAHHAVVAQVRAGTLP